MAITRLALQCMMYDLPDYKIAAAIQVPPSKLSNWQLGRAPIPGHALLRLSLLFNCNPDDLKGWAEDGTDVICIDG